LALWGNEEDLAVSIWESHGKTFRTRGSMLWAQFSAIFANFQRKNWHFLKSQCYNHFFCKIAFCLSQKSKFFRRIFF
jgi:hypothetical protein